MPFSPECLSDIVRVIRNFSWPADGIIINMNDNSFSLPISGHIKEQYEDKIINVSVYRKLYKNECAGVYMTHKIKEPIIFTFLDEPGFIVILQALYPETIEKQRRLENEKAKQQRTLQIETIIKEFVQEMAKDICDNTLSMALGKCKAHGKKHRYWKTYAEVYKTELIKIMTPQILGYDTLTQMSARLDRLLGDRSQCPP
jgi:hypothetical protein